MAISKATRKESERIRVKNRVKHCVDTWCKLLEQKGYKAEDIEKFRKKLINADHAVIWLIERIAKHAAEREQQFVRLRLAEKAMGFPHGSLELSKYHSF